MSVLSHCISPGCRSAGIIIISQQKPIRVLAPAFARSTHPPDGFSKQSASTQGTGMPAFPSVSLYLPTP